ncbi:MAG TPA: HEPN domain-containing protein [Alphaproteobacteria bacterium]|nr:HEPN domain-containing protein [Alphaproteobacteria bacterium]
MSTASDMVLRWLEIARGDLLAARNCIDGPHFLPGFAAYHCQQAAEKLVKAILVHRGIEPPKSHDIDTLADRLSSADRSRFALASLGRLTPYAIAFRYPEEDLEPSIPGRDEIVSWISEIEAAIQRAVAELTDPPA